MPRIITMPEYVDIIHRLRLGQSQRKIHTETGTHRTIIRSLQKYAKIKGWLKASRPIPDESEVREFLDHIGRKKEKPHPLDKYWDEIKDWRKEGYSFVVMQELLSPRYSCDESTIRRYYHDRKPATPKPVMLRTHIPGEILEVDFGYLGITYDSETRRNRKSYVFSARLRKSRKAYRESVFKQDQETFFNCHMNAFEYFDGVPEKVVCDNLKAAIVKAAFHSPLVNRAYLQLSRHYGFIISPCKPYHAHHKGGVESDIKYIKNNFWPLFKERSKLKGRDIPYADDLRDALYDWSENRANTRVVSGVGRSVTELFEEESPHLKPLTQERWDPIEWKQPKVQDDWRVMFDKGYYTVPYHLIGKTVSVCGNSTIIKVFNDEELITIHPRVKKPYAVSRKAEHAPPEQEKYLQSSRKGLLRRAEFIGPCCLGVVQTIFSESDVDGLRPVRGIVFGLSKKYGDLRLEAACRRALKFNVANYFSVKNILANGLDKLPGHISSDVKGQIQFRFARNKDDYNKGVKG